MKKVALPAASFSDEDSELSEPTESRVLRTASPIIASASRPALLYEGAGEDCRRIGTIKAGEVLPIIACSKDNEWLRTSTGAWISVNSVRIAGTPSTISDGSYSLATTAEFSYLKQIIRRQISLFNAAVGFAAETTDDLLVNLLSQIDELEEWNHYAEVPPDIADMGEWANALSTISSAAASRSDSDFWSVFVKYLIAGFIPSKYLGRTSSAATLAPEQMAAAPAPTSRAKRRKKKTYGERVLDLFTKAGLEISSVTYTAPKPKSLLPNKYIERWEFVIAEVAPRGGQIFVCETKADADVLIEYFLSFSALTGPNLFQSPNGLVVAQLNSGLSPATAVVFETVINLLE